MVTPDDDITIPGPTREKATGFQKALTLFAVIGVIGLGACGFTLAGHNRETTGLIGLFLIVVSLFGLVITAASMAIASVIKATEKK